jgi:PAS domain S-box-containing protein
MAQRRETRSTSPIKDRLRSLIFRETREMARKGSKSNQRKRKIATRPAKQADSWSQRSKFHFAEAQRLSRTGHWVLAVSSQRSFWSPELFRIFDFDPATQKPSLSALLKRVHPEDRPDVDKKINSVILGGPSLEHDFRLMLSGGSIKHIHAVLHPLTSNSGKTSEIIATAADITDRVRSESELKRSEAYLAEAQKISHTGCWARNPTTGALFWSQEEWRIFGLDPEKTRLSYEMFLQMVHPEDRASLEETSRRAVREKRSYDIPFRIVLPDGSIKHIHSVGKPFFEESGGVTEYIGVSMDVTERKRDETALQLAQAELARVARLTTIGELAASIAHEINQPLSAISTNCLAALRWLGHEVPNLAEAKRALERTSKEAQRASDVIGRIRALLKHDKPKYIQLEINDVIKEVITMTQSALQARGVSVRIDLPPGLPRALGDRVQLQQVLLNLIMNGADAMSLVASGPQILGLSSRVESSDNILVSIEDSGTGLEAGLSDRIFDPLFTTKPNGMGMGLAICKSIVEGHGGRIWALPGSPNGTVFQFTVPTLDGRAKMVTASPGNRDPARRATQTPNQH